MRNIIVESLQGVPVEEPLIASAQLILHLGGSWRPSVVM